MPRLASDMINNLAILNTNSAAFVTTLSATHLLLPQRSYMAMLLCHIYLEHSGRKNRQS